MIDEKLLRTLEAHPALCAALNDLPRLERVKRFPSFSGCRHALKVVLGHDAAVVKASQTENVRKSAIQAILFRETLGYGLEDVLLDKIRRDASRGICQIRPSTAAKADESLGDPVFSYQDYAHLLDRPEYSIRYCARILRAEAKKRDADALNMPENVLLSVFKAYNGSEKYAEHVLAYCKAFEEAAQGTKTW